MITTVVTFCIFALLGQFRFSDILSVLKIPTVKVEDNRNYYFLLRSFINFLLNVLEFLKVPLMMIFCLLIIDSFILKNLLMITFLISACFAVYNKFHFKNPQLYIILFGCCLNFVSIFLIPLLWLILAGGNKEKITLILAGIIFGCSLYTMYFPTAIFVLLLSGISFYKNPSAP